MGGTWDATNLVRGRRRRAHADRARPSGARIHGGPRSRARRRASSRRARSPSAASRTTRRSRDRGSAARRSARSCCSSTATSRSRSGCGPWADRRCGSAACTGPTTICSCRCSASTPRGTRRAAIVAVESLLDKPLDEATTREALAAVRWPGRLEVVARHPAVLLDGAHNPAGAEALAAALREFFIWDRLHLVISISANKDVSGIVRPLASLADIAYAAKNASERAGDALVVRRGVRRAGQAGRDVRFDRGGPRRRAHIRRRNRPHRRDGLSLYCRGRAPRAGGALRTRWRSNPRCSS